MSFRNPIVAGSVLVRNAIQSPNYVAGSMGWIIRRDGSAEFSNAIFRGSVVISGSNNILMYTASPAAGDLVISIAPSGGTDSFGNVYPAGFQILNHGGAGASGIAVSFAGTQPLLYFVTPVPNIRNDPAMIVNTSGASTAEFCSLVISGGEDATQSDYVAINLDSSSQDGTTHVAQILDAYVDSSGGAHSLILRGPGGTTIYAGSLTAVQPGTGTSRANLAVGESWHNAVMATGWTTNAGDQAPRYRLEGLAGGIVRLDGVAYTSAAQAANSTIFTLPVGYRPQQRKRLVTVTNASASAGGTVVEVFPTGVVVCSPVAGAIGDQVVLEGITFPVD